MIRAVVEPVVAGARCEIVDIEWRREPIGWVLRLYVERLGHDPRLQVGGVGLEDCVRISRDVSTAMDVAELVDHAYHLEVSSPGLERPLTKLADYERFQGLRAKLRIDPALDAHPGRRNYRGEISGVEGESVRLHDDEVGDVVLPKARIQKAHLVFEPAPKHKPGKGPGKHKNKQKPSPREGQRNESPSEVGRGDAEKDR